MSSCPSVCTNNFVFRNPSLSHLTGFTHSTSHNACTCKALPVIIQPFSGCRLDVFRNIQVHLSKFAALWSLNRFRVFRWDTEIGIGATCSLIVVNGESDLRLSQNLLSLLLLVLRRRNTHVVVELDVVVLDSSVSKFGDG